MARIYTEERRDQARLCCIGMQVLSRISHGTIQEMVPWNPLTLFLISLLVMTSDLQARVSKLCTGKFLVSCISWRKKILQRFGAFPKSWCPEIAADVLGISFLAKLPGAEVPPRGLGLP